MKNENRQIPENIFTLVELLIVISVIIILISLLLPALGKAKAKAQEIICLGNLRQCGIGIIQYCNDNNGWTPCAYRPWSSQQWGRWLISLDYLPGNDPTALLGKSSIIVCPSQYPYGKYLHLNYTYGFRKQSSLTTFFQLFKGPVSCTFYDSGADTYTPYTYASWSNPSSVNLLADTIRGAGTDPDRQWYYYNYGSSSSITSQTFHTRHSAAANALFADGHAGRITQKYFLENSLRFFDANGNLL
ncbi:MAG: hypothetical protein A2017_01530 [Lentisphaerae bacterium GWF2_44_16]|nr:MAG: hypothetical protein A2017_01530 [Lentisphaerae bacterium GWF2_44_16]